MHGFFSRNKVNNIYLTEIMQIYWLHMLDAYWYERDAPYSDDFELWPELLIQYFNEILLDESIASAYLASN